MNVQIAVAIDGREVARVDQQVTTGAALEVEEQTERLKDRVGGVVLEVGFEKLGDELRTPGFLWGVDAEPGKRPVTVMSQR